MKKAKLLRESIIATFLEELGKEEVSRMIDHGMDFTEIAKVLGTSVQNICRIHERALKKLRKIFEDNEIKSSDDL